MANPISRLAHSIFVLLITLLAASLKIMQDGLTKALYGREMVTLVQSLYDLVDKNMKGEEMKMSSFKNSVLLVVNVASK